MCSGVTRSAVWLVLEAQFGLNDDYIELWIAVFNLNVFGV